MDVLSVIAAVLGLAGVVLGGFGWWKANEAKSIADGAYRVAQESKQAATETAGVIQEPKQATAVAVSVAGERIVTTKVGSQRTAVAEREPEKSGAEGVQGEQTANLVVRSGSNPGEDLPTNQGSGSGLIGIFLVNEGPAAAHDMQLHATFPNGTRRSSELHRTLSAHKELTLFAQVVPADFGTDDPLHVLYQIAYQDGNGEQALERNIRLEGSWKGPWKTFIETKN